MPRMPLFATGIALAMITGAQAPEPTVSPLELQLQPEASESVPAAFAFLLVNRSDHEVRVPTPSIDCENSFNGAIWLHVQFRPLVPGPPDEDGFGCASDSMDWPAILERVKAWKVLGPGESLRLRADREHLHYEGDKAGTYEFWATYRPPSVQLLDQGTLWAVGLDFPSRGLDTQHLVFVKRP
jgi:hypothetical protein